MSPIASQVTVRLIDDLDGSDATQSVEFVYKGKSYRLDLNDDNALNLEKALAPYMAAAEQAGSAETSSRPRGTRRQAVARSRKPKQASDYNPKEVRVWAQANGVDLPARGRIPSEVLERFAASRT